VTAVRHVLYLHGFASSPASSKAQRLSAELGRLQVGFGCPDFNQPAFETMTVTRMLDQTAAAVAAAGRGPVCLVGSSLGAFVALHAAAEDSTGRIDRLILLAPAIDFGGNRLRQLGEHGIDEWRRTGRLRILHHAFEEEREIGFGLYEDAARYDAWNLGLDLPMLVFQGRRDETVDPAMVEEWAAGRPNVRLTLLDDGHQLSESFDAIWTASRPFLGLQADA